MREEERDYVSKSLLNIFRPVYVMITHQERKKKKNKEDITVRPRYVTCKLNFMDFEF